MEQIDSHLDPRELSDHDRILAEVKAEQPADSDYLEMYNIPGNDPVAPDALARYQNDRKQYESQIYQMSQSSPLNIEALPENERSDRIKQALQSDNLVLQVDAVSMIWSLPDEEQRNFNDKAADIAQSNFESGDGIAASKALEIVELLPESYRPKLLIEALRSDDLAVQTAVLEMIGNSIDDSSESLQPEMIEAAFQSRHPEVQMRAAEMTQYLPDDAQPEFEEMIAQTIKTALEADDLDIQAKAARAIWTAPETDRFNLIKQALLSAETTVQIEAATAIWSVPDSEQPELEEMVRNIVNQAIETNDISAQADLARIVWRMTGDKWAHIKSVVETNVETAIRQHDPIISDKIVKIIQEAPATKQGDLVQLIAGTQAVNSLVASALYHHREDSLQSPMSRERFVKTGSGTTLLGGNLKDRVIVRHVSPGPFLAWQNLYENHQLWSENGFDYVPIEPIISFRPNARDSVDVSSGVLDLSLADYLSSGWGKYKQELESDRKRILDTIGDAGARHGHPHLGNFCLRFYRDHNGIVDLEQKPRLYVIDFDRAITELIQTNEGETSTEPTEKIQEAEGREAVKERPYDERYLREVVRKVDLLKSSTEGQAFLWAISRPGACTHFFLKNRENFHKALKDLSEGRSLTMDESIATDREKGYGYDEEYLSLHPANGVGVSTAIFSEFYGLFANFYSNQSGFVLKPEYFAKLANFTDEDFMSSYETRKKIRGNADLRETRALAESIKNNTPMKFSETGSEVIEPDYGIRNATLVNGEVQEVPITPDDVEFLFTIVDSDSGLYCQFYSPQKKGWLSHSEVSELAQHCKDEKTWERYYETRNIGPRPRTAEEQEAEIRRIREQFGIGPNVDKTETRVEKDLG